jgi:hypothetical protein
MTRIAALTAGLAIGLAACSGSASDAPATEGASSAPLSSESPAIPTADAPSTDAPATAAPNPGGGQQNTAVVTIGAERYEFSDVRCDILTAGYIQAGNYGADPEVVIVLPPPGWEAQGDVFSSPQVQVSIGSGSDEQVWFAGDDPPVVTSIPDGSSQLDYSVPDGRPVTATGTGSFVDAQAVNFGREWSSVAGSFEVTCP